MYNRFEQTKKIFTANDQLEQYIVALPTSFVEKYLSELQQIQTVDDGFSFKGRTKRLSISNKKMNSFFDTSVGKVRECIEKAKNGIQADLKIIYLVGGFGGCKYMANNIRSHFAFGGVRVIVPIRPDLAVVRGACQYHDRNILEKSDATYGIETCAEYDETNPVHVRGKTRVSSDGKKFCDKLFQPFVEIGNKLEQDQVYIGSYLPLDKEQSTVSFSLYSTWKKSVDYTDGEDGNFLTQSAIVNIDNKRREKKKIEFMLDFSGIEIQVFARFEGSSERMKACVDFLSTLN